MFRRSVSVPLFVLALLAAGPPASRPALAFEEVTLTGEIVDLACYIGHDGKGPQHKKCAAKCAEMGQPVGLVTTDGKVYLLVADHADASAYEKARKLAGDQATLRGENTSKDGINALTVKEVRK
jgi:hypothetical protein